MLRALTHSLCLVAVLMTITSVCAQSVQDSGQPVKEIDVTALTEVDKPFQHKLKAAFKELPEGYKLRLRMSEMFDQNYGTGMIPVLLSSVPLNPAGKFDGYEIEYGDFPLRHIPWKNGVKHGIEKVYAHHKYVQAEIPWEKGTLHGVKKTYYAGGKLRSETTYEQGVAHGPTKGYAKDGSVSRQSHMKKGKRDGVLVEYWPGTQQKKREIPYRKGTVHGTTREWYADGQLKRQMTFKHDRKHGDEIHYLPDGTVRKSVKWKKGERVGTQ
jgi:antitoxin component YwqK of YwqJK toxin-antitoxin module